MFSFLISEVQAATTIRTGSVGGVDTGVVSIAGFNDLFSNVLVVIMEIAAVTLFGMLLVGGFKYLTSGGNPKLTEAAKHTITYAILGMLLVAASFLIIQIIEQYTGANVSEFNVVGN